MRIPDADSDVWIDGVYEKAAGVGLELIDPAIQAGLGVFETLAVRDGGPLDVEPHLVRLQEGAAALGVPLRSLGEIRTAARRIAAASIRDHGWLKILATRSGRTVVFGGRVDPGEEGRAATAVILPWKRSTSDPLAGVKSLNYASFVLGGEEASRRGCDEGLWLNSRGHLVEGCSSNLFVVRGRRLFTPSSRDGALAGVIRSLAIHAAKGLGCPVHEGKVRVKRLLSASEAFLTSSVRGVRPLLQVDGRPIGAGRPGPLTREIANRVATLRTPERPDPAEKPAGMIDPTASRS